MTTPAALAARARAVRAGHLRRLAEPRRPRRRHGIGAASGARAHARGARTAPRRPRTAKRHPGAGGACRTRASRRPRTRRRAPASRGWRAARSRRRTWGRCWRRSSIHAAATCASSIARAAAGPPPSCARSCRSRPSSPSRTIRRRSTSRGYDAAAKGYHLALAGCIACTEPMPIGSRHEPRFVTLSTAGQGARPRCPRAGPVSKSVVAFDDFAAAKRWAEVREAVPARRVPVPARAEGSDFTVGMAPGIALKLVGARVFNRCTGGDPGLEAPVDGVCRSAAARPRGSGLQDRRVSRSRCPTKSWRPTSGPEELSKAAINEVDGEDPPQALRLLPEVPQSPGALVLSYTVGGNGTVQSVAGRNRCSPGRRPARARWRWRRRCASPPSSTSGRRSPTRSSGARVAPRRRRGVRLLFFQVAAPALRAGAASAALYATQQWCGDQHLRRVGVRRIAIAGEQPLQAVERPDR